MKEWNYLGCIRDIYRMGKEIMKAETAEETTFNWSSDEEITKMPLLALNHVSFVCKSVPKSVQFYEQVLGFVLIQRPSSFDFDGAW